MNEDPIFEAISQAVTDVLEKLATLGMETRMFARHFTPLIETAFVRAVDREAERRGQPLPELTTVTARTGLHRNLVSRIRSDTSPKASNMREPYTLRVLRDWKTDTDYLNDQNEPKVLPLRGPISFNELVKRHGAGVRARTMLKELERIKAVRRVGTRHVEMLNRPDLNVQRTAQAIRDLGEYTSECLDTLIQRVTNPEFPPYYRRAVALNVDNEQVRRLIRDAASEASVWADHMQEAITHHSVTVAPGATAQKATCLSGHIFLSERPSVVAPIGTKPADVDRKKVGEKSRVGKRTPSRHNRRG